MQNFKVTVNGKVYEVTVEETTSTGSFGSAVEKTEKVEKVETIPAAAQTPSPVKQASSMETGDLPVNAPLAGNILSVKVKPGEAVKYGQVLLTLEALKMENEIVAPQAGVVKEILVSTGANVNVGDALVILHS